MIVELQTFMEGDLGMKEQHKDRLTSLLRLSGYEAGLLVNFSALDLRNGIKRIIVSGNEPALHWR